MPFGQRPRPQSHPFSTLGGDTRGVSCGKRLGGSGVCSIRVPMYIRCPHACQPRPWPTQGAGDTATHGLARRPVAEGSERPLNLPNTKKLKYFNILFFFLVPEFILWVLGSHCVIHIHIYIYNLYIYIIFFLVGFVFNSVIQNGGKPQAQKVSFSVRGGRAARSSRSGPGDYVQVPGRALWAARVNRGGRVHGEDPLSPGSLGNFGQRRPGWVASWAEAAVPSHGARWGAALGAGAAGPADRGALGCLLVGVCSYPLNNVKGLNWVLSQPLPLPVQLRTDPQEGLSESLAP